MLVDQTKTILKFLIWTAALCAVSIGMVYCFWMILLGMIFNSQQEIILSGTALLVLFGFYWKLLAIA